MDKRICVTCGIPFKSNVNNKICCSDKCRLERLRSKLGRVSVDGSIPRPTVGAISEMAIAIDLMKKGYSVFRALSQACFADLVAIKDGKTLMIECRTGYRSGASGQVYCPTHISKDANVAAIYLHATGEAVYLEPDFKKPFKI